ncbi:MAG TPA: hypothetical protein VHM70_09340 [Polyangiaceae bacterium]|nr:hypothetical protein [Polyangiaceae bacterium]
MSDAPLFSLVVFWSAVFGVLFAVRFARLHERAMRKLGARGFQTELAEIESASDAALRRALLNELTREIDAELGRYKGVERSPERICLGFAGLGVVLTWAQSLQIAATCGAVGVVGWAVSALYGRRAASAARSAREHWRRRIERLRAGAAPF